MGKVLSVISRKSRRFNAENRAHRFLDKEKRDAAPKFKANLEDYKRVLEETPNFTELESKKNIALDGRLKQVYVTSTDYVTNVSPDDEKKPLPLDRKPVEDFEFGYLEPEKAMRGYTTLRQALIFISNHQADPQTWTSQKISDDYKLKPSIVESVLKHFHTFEVYIPDIKSGERILLKDRLKKAWNATEKHLPPPKYETDEVFDRLSKEHEKLFEDKRLKAMEKAKKKQIE